MTKQLRHGYTTGACAAAASAAATRMLVRQRSARQVTINLPTGSAVTFRVRGASFTPDRAHCFIVKDAGDDPDVTHGAEIHSTVCWDPAAVPGSVTLLAGEGVGQVTKPGLAVAPGEPAINPVPRQMIHEAVGRELRRAGQNGAVRVTLSVPDGRARAEKTLNARLGILGGLSILGTTGVVRPISHQAWRDTLDAALDVASAAGTGTVVLSGGRTSELAAERALTLPEEAFILMGDHVGYALAASAGRAVDRVVLSLQFAKLVKVAAGHDCTHAHAARLELAELADWARLDGLDGRLCKQIELANTAREVFLASENPQRLAALVAERAMEKARCHLGEIPVGILLVDYVGEPFATFGSLPGREG